MMVCVFVARVSIWFSISFHIDLRVWNRLNSLFVEKFWMIWCSVLLCLALFWSVWWIWVCVWVFVCVLENFIRVRWISFWRGVGMSPMCSMCAGVWLIRDPGCGGGGMRLWLCARMVAVVICVSGVVWVRICSGWLCRVSKFGGYL